MTKRKAAKAAEITSIQALHALWKAARRGCEQGGDGGMTAFDELIRLERVIDESQAATLTDVEIKLGMAAAGETPDFVASALRDLRRLAKAA